MCAACHPFYTGTQTIMTPPASGKIPGTPDQKSDEVKGKATKKIARAAKRIAAGPKVEVEETKSGRVSKKK